MKSYPQELLQNLYATMLRIRVCEESLVEPILSGDVRCPCHLYTGEEAIAAGVCAVLGKKDLIFGTHRSHGHFIAKGGSIKEMVAEIYGKETGCCKGRGGSMHVIDPDNGVIGVAPIVAGTIPLAIGAALAFQIRKQPNVAVCFFGDGATNEGVFFESLNFAAIKKLPVIFVCENNLYSTHMPINECRPNEDIHRIGGPFDVASFEIDGNDVLQVFEQAEQAKEMCLKEQGPVLLECKTYRMRGHVGPDDNIQGTHTDIRPAEEIEHWQQKDPIQQIERYLIDNSVMDKSRMETIQQAVQQEISEAHEFAQNSPFPSADELMHYVFR
ncbi:thiamine pyrophosphate-dependent dehydrogenase E1 component subunit alpha [Thermodesulfobacteriota bacterium]